MALENDIGLVAKLVMLVRNFKDFPQLGQFYIC